MLKVSADHRNIAYDADGQKLAEEQGYKPNGNAVSIIAKIMGVKKEDEAGDYLADLGFHKQLIEVITVDGRAWVKTDATTRKSGVAFRGNRYGLYRTYAADLRADGSFRAALRVKKA